MLESGRRAGSAVGVAVMETVPMTGAVAPPAPGPRGSLRALLEFLARRVVNFVLSTLLLFLAVTAVFQLARPTLAAGFAGSAGARRGNPPAEVIDRSWATGRPVMDEIGP